MNDACSQELRVMIVDDCRDTADSWAMLIEAWGYRAYVAHNGPEVLEQAPLCQPDVILLDIGLPGMNGWEVARHLRQMPGMDKTLLIAISGFGREEDHRHSQEAGFDLHLNKPVELPIVEQLLSERQQGIATCPLST